MFQNTNEVLKTNKELLYFDEVTKINNRKYFILKTHIGNPILLLHTMSPIKSFFYLCHYYYPHHLKSIMK